MTLKEYLKKLSAKYDELYEKADKILKKYNPCKVEGKGACATCLSGRHPDGTGISFCCGGCQHLGKNGCTVKALSCKLWICNIAITEEVQREMNRIRVEVSMYGLNGFRTSKEETMESLKSQFLNHEKKMKKISKIKV